ncbi:sensor histidine kinase [Kineococcus aurantiacus]|uniref:histidine kinase n=1 Tax=Kineococcus aurantiacus TaxID=37633 RepID=A0A7Y9DJC2_9ACTN|nr:histidine kinase [Kineococcus aurantiacus]NYD20503.1 signal transduction histidine kinase [Kineococcus aurantiacus]
MSRWQVLRRWDVALPLLLTAVAQVELHLPYSTESAPVSPAHSLFLLGVTLPLVAQRRAPSLAPVAAAAVWAVEPLLFPVTNTFAVPLTVLGLGPLAAARWAPTPARAWAGCVCVVALIAVQGATNAEYGVGGTVSGVVFGSALAVVGAVWRRHTSQRGRAEERAAAEHEAREESERALATERARIARELHDAVGHGLSVVVLQARGARRVLTADPVLAGNALDEVERAAMRSIHEMRLLTGLLRLPTGAAAPQPGLEELGALAETVRAAGTPVALRLPTPLPDLPTALAVTCYRIVQEALTNALRHAPGSAVQVEVRLEARSSGSAVVLQVLTDRPTGAVAPAGEGDTGAGRAWKGGTGLPGVRERVDLFGGRLDVGPLPGGGHRLHASLPVPAPGRVARPLPDDAGRAAT